MLLYHNIKIPSTKSFSCHPKLFIFRRKKRREGRRERRGEKGGDGRN